MCALHLCVCACAFIGNTCPGSILVGQRVGDCSSLTIGWGCKDYPGSESQMDFVSSELGKKTSLDPEAFQSWSPLKHRSIKSLQNFLEKNSGFLCSTIQFNKMALAYSSLKPRCFLSTFNPYNNTFFLVCSDSHCLCLCFTSIFHETIKANWSHLSHFSIWIPMFCS